MFSYDILLISFHAVFLTPIVAGKVSVWELAISCVLRVIYLLSSGCVERFSFFLWGEEGLFGFVCNILLCIGVDFCLFILRIC